MVRLPRSAATMAFALGALTLAGCSGADLTGPATLDFQGMTRPDADRIEKALREEGFTVARADGPKGTTLTLSDIDGASRLKEAHSVVMEAAKHEQIEVKFDGTTLRYSSLTASGSATTMVTIVASPGATAYIADQEGSKPWRLIQLDGAGKWQGAVKTRGPVAAQGGWLYAAVTRDEDLYRYLKVNVLTTEQQTTTFAEVQKAGLGQPPPKGKSATGTPSNSAAPGAKPAEKKDTGAKWPWQK